MKIQWKPGTLIYPLPALMVSSGSSPEKYNIFTASWTGTICSDPAMCYVSIRRSRLSHELISESGCFVLNLTTEKLARATDWCGVKSGRDFNKFAEMGLTAEKAAAVNAPIIKESPINIECEVFEIKPLGSHDMFLARVVNVQADEEYLDPATGAFDMEAAGLIAYSHGHYHKLGEEIGRFGWSVRKGARG